MTATATGGGSGTSTLTSPRVEVDLEAFTAEAMARGWGDGLPLVPPTEARVAEAVAASRRRADEVVARIDTVEADITVEKVAVNAVMAGAPAAAMPLVCASLQAMADPTMELAGLNATTAPVVPALFVNGPIRHELGLAHQGGCLGGAAGPGPAIGRALRLVMRNVAGQQVGRTSESVFGQPGRVVGIVVGEWEERSPWAPLAERRGVPGDAVTAFAAMGTGNILDMVAATGPDVLEVVGKSIAELGTNAFVPQAQLAEVVVALNPTWASEVVGRDLPDIADVQELIWEHAALPVSWFPERFRAGFEEWGRIKPDGRVHMVSSPDDVIVLVCGGEGGLHAAFMHCFSGTLAATRPVD